MDGLALLCNLHADGPRTLRRLRDAGVHTLGELEGFAEGTLADWMGSAQAHRFLQEARQLASRLAEGPLEPEELHDPVPDPGFDATRSLDEPESSDLGATLRAGSIAGLDERTCERLVAQDVTTLQALVGQTSLSLARRAGIPFPRLLHLSCQARRLLVDRCATPASSGEPRAAVSEFAPESAPEYAGTPLRAGAIDGLDAETCERLSDLGVRTTQELVERADLALARRAGIPFTKLLDLSSRAQSFLAQQAELRPEPPRRAPSLSGLSLAFSTRSTHRSVPVWRAWVSALTVPGQAASAEQPVECLVPEERARELAATREEPGVGGPFG